MSHDVQWMNGISSDSRSRLHYNSLTHRHCVRRVNSAGYYYEGFLAVQRAVDLSIMTELTGGNLSVANNFKNVSLMLKSFPYPPYQENNFLTVLATQFPFIIMVSFIVIAPTICKDVVLEKEKKLKVCNIIPNYSVNLVSYWTHRFMSWFLLTWGNCRPIL